MTQSDVKIRKACALIVLIGAVSMPYIEHDWRDYVLGILVSLSTGGTLFWLGGKNEKFTGNDRISELNSTIAAYKRERLELKHKIATLQPPTYDHPLEEGDEDDMMTVEEFREACETEFIDYDGFGVPVKDGNVARGYWIYPSEVELIPKDATHIIWANR